jgi:hypothetical protein
MIRLQQYLIASSSLGCVGGVLHGSLIPRRRPEDILMGGLQGLIIGPYAPIIIPYVAVSNPCPSFRLMNIKNGHVLKN